MGPRPWRRPRASRLSWQPRSAPPAAARRRGGAGCRKAAFNAAALHRPPSPRGARTRGLLHTAAPHVRGAQKLVNRAGNALLDLGCGRSSGCCAAADSPGFRHALGRDWASASDPREHHDAERRLPVFPRRQPRARRGRLGVPAGRGGPRAAGRPLPAARGGGRTRLRSPDRVRRLGGQGEPAGRALRRLQGRSRVLALLVGPDRPSQGRGPPAARHGGVRRDLLEGVPRHDRRSSHRLGGQALLRLRDGQQHDLPAPGGRPGRAVPAPAHARGDVRADPPPPAHALLRGTHALRGDAAGEGGREALRPLVPAPLRLGGGGAARGALPPLAGALRGGDPRRHRHHRDPPHLPLEPAGPRPPRLDGPGGAGLRGDGGGRRRPPDARG